MPKQGAISRTSQGNPIARNPARIEFAAEQLRHLTYTKARDAIMERWGVGRATAERDIRAARDLIASELDVAGVRVAEMRRNERIADRSEDLAAEAAKAQDWAGVASLHRSAIAASREVARLTGACAPTEVKVAHNGSTDVELRLDAVLDVTAKILTPDEYDFLMRVMEKLAAAQDAGAFAALEDADVTDAEIVDDDLDDKN